MSRRPTDFTQADIARAIRAAKQAGASEVVLKRKGETDLVIRLQSTDTQISLVPEKEIIL